MKKTQTLRQLLERLKNNPRVIDYIYNKDSKEIIGRDISLTRDKTEKAYQPVIEELLSKPATTAYRYPILVEREKDFLSKKWFIGVSFFNKKGINPPKGLLPWGGKNYPKGYYNCNDAKYQIYYAFGYEQWRIIIDTPVIIKGKINQVEALGEILWNITFNGWTEKEADLFKKDLEKYFLKAKKEIETGQYKVLKAKNKNERDIVIPHSVEKQIEEISKII